MWRNKKSGEDLIYKSLWLDHQRDVNGWPQKVKKKIYYSEIWTAERNWTSNRNKFKVNEKNIEVDTPVVKEIDTSQHGAVGNEILRGIIESAVNEEVFEDKEEDFNPLRAVKSPTKKGSC